HTIDALRKLLPGAFFGTGQQAVLLAVMAVAARSRRLLRRALAGADAVQIPPAVRRLSLVSPRLLDAYLQHAREVHVWTVNDRELMQRLLAAGVAGIITDETALARKVIDRSDSLTGA
ncbi:glycerophosphodiester phosphodiesterase family protein, partial [Gulosibacter hominis]